MQRKTKKNKLAPVAISLFCVANVSLGNHNVSYMKPQTRPRLTQLFSERIVCNMHSEIMFFDNRSDVADELAVGLKRSKKERKKERKESRKMKKG